MFTNFTFIMIWNLYILADNGNVFYVGITRNLEKRYKYHCSFRYETTHEYIHWIKEDNRLPEIHILCRFFTQRQAEFAETSLIRYFVVTHHKLCNNDLNPISNRIITCNPYPLPNKKKRLKRNYAKEVIEKALQKYYLLDDSHRYKDFIY